MSDTNSTPVTVNTNADPFTAAITSLLIASGGYFVQKGYVDNNQLTSIVGGLVALASAGWAVYSHTTSVKISSVAKIMGVSRKQLQNNIVAMRRPPVDKHL